MILLGGSDGDVMEGSAAVLASRGYTALALANFGAPLVPPELIEVPLGTSPKRLSGSRLGPPSIRFVAPSWVSRGGELTLLLGATYLENIKAGVGYAASGIV